MSYFSIRACTTALALVSATLSPVWAQLPQPSPRPSSVTVPGLIASAVKVTEAPTIDGLLDEGMWQGATPLGGFVQAEPLEGMPGSENTEVRLLYDDEAIYVGVTLHDRDPSLIVTTETRRDADLGEMDSFQMIFDTFHDRQNGFVFGTNAAGVQYDAQVRDQGEQAAELGRQLGGANQPVTDRLDGRVPDSVAHAPVRTGAADVGCQLPPQHPAHPRADVLGAARARLRPGAAVIGRRAARAGAGDASQFQDPALRRRLRRPELHFRDRRPDTTVRSASTRSSALTPSLNLDLTYNTDFAQVEVDTQQINLSRFNLRFPEKRPFFLENSGLFTIGKDEELDLFFSRRIGLDEDGAIVPIVGGGRLSGKINGFNVGVLNMQTDDIRRGPANNFSVCA